MPRAYSHIVFDLDGTLVDTERPVLLAWSVTLAGYGIHREPDELRAVLGLATSRALPPFGLTDVAEFDTRWCERYAAVAGTAAWFPGIPELIRALGDAGVRTGIVTSRTRREIETFFAPFALDERFPLIVSSDETSRYKPEPDPLLRYLERSGAAARDCLYIGDAATDLMCAHAAGAAAGLVCWGSAPTQEARSLADHLLANADDVLALANARRP